MAYQKELIQAYRSGQISRIEFCHRWAQSQGFDDTVKGYGNKYGTFITYRGRTARIQNGALVWSENHNTHSARAIPEMKTKIDLIEREGAKWT